MIVEISEVKDYLKVDIQDDDLLIGSLINLSEEVIKNITGKEFDSTNEIAKNVAKMLIAMWYENRGNVNPSNNPNELPFGVHMLLMQLSYCY